MNLNLDPRKTAVLVIDLQNDNLADDGAAGGSESLRHAREVGVVPNSAAIAATARSVGAKVIHVHFVIDPEAGGAGTNIPLFESITTSKIVVRGAYGAAAVEGAEPQEGDIVLDRPRMSSFHGTPLDTILRNLGITHLVITGVHTSHAVGTTARVAADLGYTPIVVSDATAAMNADMHAADLTTGFDEIAIIADTETVRAALTS